ncbi:hypothetical protein DUNSADRAFT_4945 [Dunaliella salina]|uniref:Uncharacterized protein n=1 Tax=Dunaliella salina TaxID=3046 RepID=A0ABQ7GQY2_DUNSA|nr:hypothetical protein DUNSADRAFT_4945 [Dunaliella salina]|eukprot:KAF5837020.1 hypothetical protein DUNSADRAFT_4945 [Dunaliella salina]
MNFRALGAGGGLPNPFGPWLRFNEAQQHSLRKRASSSASSSSSSSGASTSGRGSYFERVKGWQGPWKAALTSGSLSATGDLLAQFGQAQINQRQGRLSNPYDPSRTLRMFGYGLCIYGPYQYYWYNLLGWLMPANNTLNFLTKVAANQLLLAPVTLSTVFSWNLALTGKASDIPSKIRDDLLPTMVNGWKFWVPAASINFYAIPVEKQVLYMSLCGVLWTAYLSYASCTAVGPVPSSRVSSTLDDKR